MLAIPTLQTQTPIMTASITKRDTFKTPVFTAKLHGIILPIIPNEFLASTDLGAIHWPSPHLPNRTQFATTSTDVSRKHHKNPEIDHTQTMTNITYQKTRLLYHGLFPRSASGSLSAERFHITPFIAS